jgi:hypothetical protein
MEDFSMITTELEVNNLINKGLKFKWRQTVSGTNVASSTVNENTRYALTVRGKW